MTVQHLVVDCSNNGRTTRVPATDEEVAQITAQQIAYRTRKEAEAEQLAVDQAAVRLRSASDPDFAALARLAGVAL